MSWYAWAHSNKTNWLTILFCVFFCELSLQSCGIELPLPSKKWFGKTDSKLVSERQQGLQLFLDSITSSPILSRDIEFCHFVDPKHFSEDFGVIALKNVSMFFRSQPDLAVEERLSNFGMCFGNRLPPVLICYLFCICWRMESQETFLLNGTQEQSKIKEIACLGMLCHAGALPP